MADTAMKRRLATTGKLSSTVFRFVLILLLIAAPLAVGFSAGVLYAALRIMWSALVESFSAGRRLLNG